MIWKKHSHGVPNVLIPNAKILSEKACDATLGKPNRSFVAFLDNILTLLIITFKTPSKSLVTSVALKRYFKRLKGTLLTTVRYGT